ncbi:MAG: hypothetical protein MUP16_08440 [Sedimentisphaerales bacterium]|nr:hypothetical protein [Sedimentisphaerales bacterium]
MSACEVQVRQSLRAKVRFEVFQNGQIVDKFRICGAYIFGTDGIGIRRAKIRFKNGLIECERPNLETAGLALLWPVNGLGRMLLPTTCLPEKDKPYNLNLEIARAKLMQVVTKREDWSFFDGLEGLEDISKQAYNLFIQAIQNNSDAPVASQLADKALQRAIVLSEALATGQAEVLFNARGKGPGFGRGCLGCRVDLSQIGNIEYVKRVIEIFGSVTIPINWAHIESVRGNFDFSAIDACVNIFGKRKLIIGAGPLLRFSRQALPGWLLEGGLGFEKIRDTAYQFVSKVVARYSGIVHRWIVSSSLNLFNHFGFSFEQVLEMTRAANMAVKAAGGRALRIIEISNPWGEYYATMPHTIPPLVYMDMVVQSGINFDAFGLAVRFGKNQAGMHVRDMMQISAVLDYFGPVAKPLFITGLEVPSQSGDGLYSGKVAGVWHQDWDQQRQAEWIEQFYKIALSKPYVDSVTYSALADMKDSAIANSGLLTSQFEPKQSYQVLKKLHATIFHHA